MISNRWNSAITEYALRCAQALKNKGVPQVFSALTNSPADLRARHFGFDLLSFDDFSSLSTLQKLRQVASKIKPSHIICYGGQEDFLCRFLPGKSKKIRFYGQEFLRDSVLNRIKFSSLFEHHYYKITPCFKLENQLKQVCSFKNIKTITLGLDSDEYFFPKEWQKSEHPLLCIFGRLDPIKGHREFLKIFKRTLELYSQEQIRPHLKIIGQEANLKKQDLQLIVDQYGLTSHVEIIVERIKSPSNFMSQCNLGVVSSLGSETICRVAEEFLLSGTRIFVSGVGGLEDLLVEKNYGSSYLTLSTNDAAQMLRDQISLAINESAEDKQARSKLAEKHFGLEAFASKWLITLFY